MDSNYESESTGNAWPERPFLTILYQPRSTIRAIVDSNPKKYVLLLASLTGIVQALNLVPQNFPQSLNSDFDILVTILIILIGGAMLGIAGCYVGSFFSRRVSNLLGGVSTSESVRAAFVWSSMPTVLFLSFWMIKIAIYGGDVFNKNSTTIIQNPIPYITINLIEFIFEFWAIFLFWKCLAEVNRFSIWKSLLVQIIVGILILLVFIVIQLANSI